MTIEHTNEVLLYSGGMDSYIMAHMFPNAQLLYVDTGSKYAAKEIANLKNAPRAVIVDSRLSLSDVERPDSIVPLRNLFLVSIAAYYGNKIYLSATSGDNSTDKDDKFAGLATHLLSYVMSDKRLDRSIQVQLPTKHMTKADMVKWYLRENLPIHRLTDDTLSCYAPEDGHCGVCKACLRKWIAFKRWGIELDHDWKIMHPRDWGGWRDLAHDIIVKGKVLRGEEDTYTVDVLIDEGII